MQALACFSHLEQGAGNRCCASHRSLIKQLVKNYCGSPILQSHLGKHTLTCRHVVHAMEVREARLVSGIVGLVDECSDSIYDKVQ